MRTYGVIVPWFASVYVEVQAKNKKEAMEKALKDAHASLCHQCSGDINMDGGPDEKNLDEDCVDELKR